MKKTLTALCLLVCLLLSGCAGVLNRSYSAETPHPQYSDADIDSGYLRADSYQKLVSAILFLVSQGDESGVIRLYDYTGPAESDLDAAYWEVIQLDPMGAYAVDYIKYELNKAVSYYEIELSVIAYRRSLEQIASVVSVTGISAISGELQLILSEFQQEAVYRVSYFDQSVTVEEIARMVDEAYYETPASAVGKPEVTVQLYPQEYSGRQRMVEILLDYPAEQAVLLERQQALARRVQELMGLRLSSTEEGKLEQVQGLLGEYVTLTEEPGYYDAYAALVLGKADQEGYSLAAKLLCDQMGLPCRIVLGTREGADYYWVMVQMGGQWQHWDPSREAPALLGDEALRAQGYHWSGDYPPCPERSE